MAFATLSPSTHDTVPNAEVQTVTMQRVAFKVGLSMYAIEEQTIMGMRVLRCRRYYDGEHDIPLSSEVMKQLDIKDRDDGMALNMMPSVVDTMADRCVVQAIEGIEDTADSTEEGTDSGTSKVIDTTAELVSSVPAAPNVPKTPTINAATKWAQEVQDNNDFDVIQGVVHTSTITDGNTYVLIEWDSVAKQARFYHELAWDGQTGMLMVYKSRNSNEAYCAVKIWQIDEPSQGNSLSITTRMNVYYTDRCEKFISRGFDEFAPYTDDDSKGGVNGVFKYEFIDGMPIGIPVVHFRNGGRNNYGVSELRNVIPVQNALNRFHYDAIVAASLTAFPIYKQFGFTRDTDSVKPGMIVKIEGEIGKDQFVDFTKLDGSDISPITNVIATEKQNIFEISRTPDPGLSSGSGSNKSGEYLKQLEVGLIGKVHKFTTRAGSSWEQVFAMAHKLQQAYGTLKPPPYKRFVCRWKDPEVRNNTDVVTNAVTMDPIWGHEETMRAVSSVYDDLTEDRIQDIIAKQSARDVAMARAMQAQQPIAPGQQPTDTAQPPALGNAPAIRGAKLPADQSLKVNPITPDELAAVGAMHRKLIGWQAA